MGMGWNPDANAEAKVDALYERELAPLDLEGFGIRLVGNGDRVGRIEDAAGRAEFGDALHELAELSDEIRFEVALAALIMWDFAERVQRGEAQESVPPDHGREELRGLPLPVEVSATMVAYHPPLPSPIALLQDPYKHIAGFRVLGIWFAAQLLDSAMFRCVAALDRLVVLLWTNAGQAFERRKDGSLQFPAFRRRDLKRLASVYGDRVAWQSLEKLLDHELFKAGKGLRDLFTHRRRGRFQGHGNYNVSYETEAVRPADSTVHIAYVAAFFNSLVRPAVDHTRQLVIDAESNHDR